MTAGAPGATGGSGVDLRSVLAAASMDDVRGLVFRAREIWCCLWRRGTAAATSGGGIVADTANSTKLPSSPQTTPTSGQLCMTTATCDVRGSVSVRVQPLDVTSSQQQQQLLLQHTVSIYEVPGQTLTTQTSQQQRPTKWLDCGSNGRRSLDRPHPVQPVTYTPPLSLKSSSAKGLLERRASNASLSLDLSFRSATVEKPPISVSPTESSMEEFLSSAEHRMTWIELCDFLKTPRAVYDEFSRIPLNQQLKIAVTGSGVKNRYCTILPNEPTRVQLRCGAEDSSLASYINANYIRGYNGEPKAYIATQGPMENTVNDLWRMVWQEKSPAIVMVTKHTEQNLAKCECYMPESRGVFGDIQVQVVCQKQESHGCQRRFLAITNVSDIEAPVLHTIHYWYSSWPDHQAPDTINRLLYLVNTVDRQRLDPQTHRARGPVIVHCSLLLYLSVSAGIGRTGCFIATSIAVKQLTSDNTVDILRTVCRLRSDRGGMIQTFEQYEFIHYAVRDSLQIRLKSLSSSSDDDDMIV